MGLLAIMPLLLVAQTHTNWEASLRTEVRARTVTPQDNGSGAAGDAEVRPRLQGAVFNGPWTLSASYSPTFRTREPYITKRAGQPIGDHSHAVSVDGVWVKEGSARVFAGEFIRYGTLDLSTLTREAAVPGQPVAPQPVRTGLGLVQELTFDTSAGVDWYLSQRLTLTTTAGFVYGGGADPVSQRTLPLQSTYRGLVRLAWLASRLDTLSLNLSGQYIRFFQVPATEGVAFNPGARIVILELSATYARLLAVRTDVYLTLGVTGALGQIPNTVDPLVSGAFRNINGVAPLASAGINHREQYRAQRFDFRLNASYAPFVDRFAGTVYQRVEGGGTIGWSNVHHFNAALSAGVARSIPVTGEAPLTTVYTEASAGYQGDPWWRVDLVGRLSVNRQSPLPPAAGMDPAPPTPLDTQWVVGVSLTLIAASNQPRIAPAAE